VTVNCDFLQGIFEAQNHPHLGASPARHFPSHAQRPNLSCGFVIRTTDDPARMIAAARDAMRSVDPEKACSKSARWSNESRTRWPVRGYRQSCWDLLWVRHSPSRIIWRRSFMRSDPTILQLSHFRSPRSRWSLLSRATFRHAARRVSTRSCPPGRVAGSQRL
jgi:hypothetical protein